MNFEDPELVRYFDEAPLWSPPFGRMILERVEMRRGQRILDVGCGTGFLALELAQRLGRGTHVDAVDIWKTALERVRGKVAYFGLENIACHEVDAAELPFADATFDLIVSNVGINNFERADVVAAECARVARPGAALILSTNLRGHMAEFYEVFDRVLAERGMDTARERLTAHIDHRATRETVTALVEGAGFNLETWDEAVMHLSYADGPALFEHYFIRFSFLDAWRAVVDAAAVDDVFAALAEAIPAPITLTIPMACAVARRAGS